MTLQVRRVVTGHDATGKSIISSDEIIKPIDRGAGANITGCEVWSTDRMPVDNSAEAEASQKAGFVYIDRNSEFKRNNYVRTGAGSLIRIIEWGPGHPPYTHRTETVDYIVILSGEIDCELDDEVVHLKAGDTLVQRGGLHTWMNRGTTPCVMAGVLLDATPVEAGGKVLNTRYPDF
jgi:mannose-6-phosphate isomerase-like protein (cupin superfamily)